MSAVTISKISDLRISELSLREDGILHIDIRANETFKASDVKEVVEAAGKIGNGASMANLITVGQFTTPDSEARSMAAHPEWCKYKIADAFVLRSFSQVMVANFYIKFNKPCKPTRYFMDEKSAIEWLRSVSSS
jgi:hypothetical protein